MSVLIEFYPISFSGAIFQASSIQPFLFNFGGRRRRGGGPAVAAAEAIAAEGPAAAAAATKIV